MINLFIAFDGIDGSGKTSQVKMVANKLQDMGLSVCQYDMGKEGFFDEIFAKIKAGSMSCNAEIRELLYYFEGVLFGKDIVTPLLNNPSSIGIVDRYILSFNSYGPLNGVERTMIRKLTRSMPWPDFYFFINTTPDTAMSRIQQHRKIDRPEIGYRNNLDNNEDENYKKFLAHQSKVYENFLTSIEDFSQIGKVIPLDGNLSPDLITEQVVSYLLPALKVCY